MSAHTPGPWKVVNHPRVAHVDSMRSVGHGANGMASIVWLTGGALAQEANARLIAAAPDLLAALKAARAFVAQRAGWSGSHNDKVAEQVLVEVDAAIAKAEGKS